MIIADAKRLIGRKFDENAVQSDMKHWPFTVVSEGGKPKCKVEYKGEDKTFFPEEISSMVLVKMKETAEAYLGKVNYTNAGSLGGPLKPLKTYILHEIL